MITAINARDAVHDYMHAFKILADLVKQSISLGRHLVTAVPSDILLLRERLSYDVYYDDIFLATVSAESLNDLFTLSGLKSILEYESRELLVNTGIAVNPALYKLDPDVQNIFVKINEEDYKNTTDFLLLHHKNDKVNSDISISASDTFIDISKIIMGKSSARRTIDRITEYSNMYGVTVGIWWFIHLLDLLVNQKSLHYTTKGVFLNETEYKLTDVMDYVTNNTIVDGTVAYFEDFKEIVKYFNKKDIHFTRLKLIYYFRTVNSLYMNSIKNELYEVADNIDLSIHTIKTSDSCYDILKYIEFEDPLCANIILGRGTSRFYVQSLNKDGDTILCDTTDREIIKNYLV